MIDPVGFAPREYRHCFGAPPPQRPDCDYHDDHDCVIAPFSISG
jgi:hypothetical protein